MGVEDALESFAVVDVGDVHGEVGRGLVADDGLDAVLDLGRGVRQVVDDDNLVAALKQLDDGVGANESGAAGNKDAGIGKGLGHASAPFGG